jgi:hypothetical protein
LIGKWAVQTTHTGKATKLSRNSKAWSDAHDLAWANTRKV